MALVTFVATIRTDEQSVVEKGLHKVFSPRPVNGFAATVRAMSGTSSFEYEFHVAPFKAELLRFYRRCQGLGHQQSGGQPYVGSYILLARPGRIQEKHPLPQGDPLSAGNRAIRVLTP